MVFTWGIIIILALGLISGYRRGFVSVVMSLLAYIVAWLIATIFSQTLAEFLFQSVTSTNSSAIATPRMLSGVVFFILFGLAYSIVRHIGRKLNLITRLPLIHSVNALVGAALNFIVRYLLIFLVLNLLLLFSNQWIKTQYQNSPIAQDIVKNTPVMSKQLIQSWQQNN
ncbi:CvpA family protein [Lactobacillus sp. LC28-10]|uniref:CvpA family protein n=1 Tax=Secundilactobacillus angelensis TaxID=2722706 RepID=A0ABX1KZ21_9LACO|nr:CvpA family protein [Secundilactobacillus angelensis]MCH5462120.1 CvpA family protein [Secundilactobacillus angelensis]NLR18399.1 CvpA family protein [Secundilactobacillus angelensis]